MLRQRRVPPKEDKPVATTPAHSDDATAVASLDGISKCMLTTILVLAILVVFVAIGVYVTTLRIDAKLAALMPNMTSSLNEVAVQQTAETMRDVVDAFRKRQQRQP